MVTLEVEADAEGYRYRLSCIKNGKEAAVAEHEEDFTNTINTKYLLALNTALRRMTQPSDILIKFKKNGSGIYGAIIQGWPQKWEENNWKTKKQTEVKHKELWQQYLRNTRNHAVTATIKEEGAGL